MELAQQLQQYDYCQLLEMVEDFCEKSGIRHYCSNVCGGDCCLVCPDRGPRGCQSKQGRKLSCSLHLCPFLIKHFLENGLGSFIAFVAHAIDAMQMLALQVEVPYNIFYCELPDLVMSELKIDKTMVDVALSEAHCQKVRAIFQELKQEVLVN